MGAGNGSSCCPQAGTDKEIHPQFHALGWLKHILVTLELEKEEEWKVCSLYKVISSLQQSCETSKHAQKQTPPCAARSGAAPGATSWQKIRFELPLQRWDLGEFWLSKPRQVLSLRGVGICGFVFLSVVICPTGGKLNA